MFSLRNDKETKWEKLEGAKLKRLEEKNALMNELQKKHDAIGEAILNEQATDDLTKAKNTLQEKIRNIEEELQLLEAEQLKARLEHCQAKINLIEDQVNKKVKELEPHRIKYEKAKKKFKETEAEWGETYWLFTKEIEDLEKKKSMFKSEIYHMEGESDKSIVIADAVLYRAERRGHQGALPFNGLHTYLPRLRPQARILRGVHDLRERREVSQPRLCSRMGQKMIKDYRVEGIYFSDNNFLINRGRAVEICERLVAEGLHKQAQWSAQVRADSLDEEILTLMRRAGCVKAEVGVESSLQAQLDTVDKKTTVQDNERAVGLCRRVGIKVHAYMITGFEGEKSRTWKKTCAG